MVTVKRQCEHLGCVKQKHFNVPASISGRFCSEHKHASLVDVITRKCEHPNCMKRPYFKVLGHNNGRLCNEHREEGMVSDYSD